MRTLPALLPLALALALAVSTSAAPAMAQESNKDFVVRAVTELFSEKDLTAIDRYWADSYMQRNPGLASTSAVLKEALKDNAAFGGQARNPAPRCLIEGKVIFNSEAAARKAMRSKGDRLRTYVCKHCNGWHLTSRTNRSR